LPGNKYEYHALARLPAISGFALDGGWLCWGVPKVVVPLYFCRIAASPREKSEKSTSQLLSSSPRDRVSYPPTFHITNFSFQEVPFDKTAKMNPAMYVE
jgi:hypothetical protein